MLRGCISQDLAMILCPLYVYLWSGAWFQHRQVRYSVSWNRPNEGVTRARTLDRRRRRAKRNRREREKDKKKQTIV